MENSPAAADARREKPLQFSVVGPHARRKYPAGCITAPRALTFAVRADAHLFTFGLAKKNKGPRGS